MAAAMNRAKRRNNIVWLLSLLCFTSTGARHDGTGKGKYSPKQTDVDEKQHNAVKILYEATNMASTESTSRGHGWFEDKYNLGNNIFAICSFEGIECKYPDGKDQSTIIGIHLPNMGMSGSLPEAAFSALPNLESINFASNALRGTLPQTFLDLGKLKKVDLSNNELSGTFPAFKAAEATLSKLMVGHNKLHSTLPAEAICPLHNLKSLDISGNEEMHGTLPSCIEDFNDLSTFKFDGVGLHGSIPTNLCSFHRPMNELDPNVFGCDAIACPMGSFEPTKGRQSSDQTPCRPCHHEKTQDSILVMGATTCSETQSIIVSESTESPSFAPFLVPAFKPSSSFHPSRDKTVVPTVLASLNASHLFVPTTTTISPDTSPTNPLATVPPSFTSTNIRLEDNATLILVPTTTTTRPDTAPTNPHDTVPPSSASTNAEHEDNATLIPHDSLRIKYSLNLDVVLVGINRMLHVELEVRLMEDTIMDFLVQLQDGKTSDSFLALIQVTLTGQRLITDGQIQAGNHVQFHKTMPLNLRRLQSASGISALVMSTEVVVAKSVTSEGTELDMIDDMNDNIAEFVQLVRDEFRVTTLFEAQPIEGLKDPPVTTAAVVDSAFVDHDGDIINRDESRPRLALLWSALALASVSVFSVAFLHVLRCRRRVEVRYRRQPHSGPSVGRPTSSVDDNGNTMSTHNTVSRNSNRTNTTQAEERGEVIPGMDTHSSSRSWKNRYTASRWNTFHRSRSVPDSSYLHGDISSLTVSTAANWRSHSLRDLLDPYGTEDVWSVAPDDDLVTSVNGSSCCDGSGGGGGGSSRPNQPSNEYGIESDDVVASQRP
jgi:Leucine rich repeat